LNTTAGVEEAEEDDAGAVEEHVERRAVLQRRGDGDDEVAPGGVAGLVLAGELDDGERHEQQ
jgi:hypothetical protein